MVHTSEPIFAHHPFFAGLDGQHWSALSACARPARFAESEFLIHEGEVADLFYLILSGDIALTSDIPGRGQVIVQTLDGGDILGWSWLFAPYRWHLSAKALTETSAVTFYAGCLRNYMEKNPEVGYRFMRQFAQIAVDRLQASRLQLLDIYQMPA